MLQLDILFYDVKNMKGAKLIGADLTGADLAYANLPNSIILNPILSEKTWYLMQILIMQ